MSLPPQPWVPGTGLGSGDTGPPADPAPPILWAGSDSLGVSGSLGQSRDQQPAQPLSTPCPLVVPTLALGPGSLDPR